jgi:hypothetical protein
VSTSELADESPDRYDIPVATSPISVPAFRTSTHDTPRHFTKPRVEVTLPEHDSADGYLPDLSETVQVCVEIGRQHSKLTTTVGGTAGAKRHHRSEEPAVEPVSFDDMVFTLGTINHRHDVSVQPRNIDNQAVRKHLRIMDLLALLLVTEEQGDVACAAFCRGPGGLVTVVFAKNRPCNKHELHYIRLLEGFILELAQPCKDTNIGSVLSALLATIFSNCQKKIRSTHRDMVNASDTLSNGLHTLPLDVGQVLWKNLCRRFPKYIEECPGPDENSRAQAFVRLWISKLKEPLTKESWKFLVQAALVISSTEKFVEQDFMQVHINHRTVYESMRRYADYYDAVQMLVCNARTYKVDLDRLFLIEAEVKPGRERKGKTGEKALDLLNRFHQQRDPDTPEFSADAVIKAFPDLRSTALVAPQSSRQEVGVHAECAVALFLLKFGLLDDDRLVWKVGISKPMCWMCRRYLRWLAKTTGTTNHFSSYHGKIYPGWACPMDVFPNFLNDVQAYSLPTSKFWTFEPSNEIPNGMRLPHQLASNMLHEVQEQVAWICDKVSGRKRKEDCALNSEPEDSWPLEVLDAAKAELPVDEVALGISILGKRGRNQTFDARRRMVNT